MSPRLLTARDVAERLSISRTKAFDLLNKGTIPAIHIGRNIRVEEQDLEKYISDNKVSGVDNIKSVPNGMSLSSNSQLFKERFYGKKKG